MSGPEKCQPAKRMKYWIHSFIAWCLCCCVQQDSEPPMTYSSERKMKLCAKSLRSTLVCVMIYTILEYQWDYNVRRVRLLIYVKFGAKRLIFTA